MKSSKEWKLVDNRHKRWESIYTNDRWEDWTVNPKRSTVLTDQEIEEVIDMMISKCERYEKESRNCTFRNEDKDTREHRFVPLAAGVSKDSGRTIAFWYSDRGAYVPDSLYYSEDPRRPDIQRRTANWKRTNGGIKVNCTGHQYRYDVIGDIGEEDDHFLADYKIFRDWVDNRTLVDNEILAADKAHYNGQKIADEVCRIAYLAIDQSHANQRENYFYEFTVEQHGDPELWEEHLEDLEFISPNFRQLENACGMVLERGGTLIGRRLGDIVDEAVGYGLLKNDDKDDDRLDPAIPREFIIPEDTDCEEEAPESDKRRRLHRRGLRKKRK